MQDAITYVGLDVHQEEIAVAVLEGGSRRPQEFQVSGDGRGVGKLVRGMAKLAGQGPVECAYEAGPCGYTPTPTGATRFGRRLRTRGYGLADVAVAALTRGQSLRSDSSERPSA